MIIEINAFCRLFSEAMHEKDPLKALKADIQKSRSNLIERLYHEADGADDFLYAPAYCTLAETDDHHAFMALFTDFFEAEDVDISTLRRFKRMVRNALASDSDLEIQEVIANAFEGRLRYFHELNDRIGEELDALAESPYLILQGREFMTEANRTRTPSDDSYFIAECNIRAEATKKEAYPRLDDAFNEARVKQKTIIMDELEKDGHIHFYPGGYAVAPGSGKATIVSRFVDLVAYTGITEEEAKKRVEAVYSAMGSKLGGDGVDVRLSHPRFSETDFRVENPYGFTQHFGAITETLRNTELEDDTIVYY